MSTTIDIRDTIRFPLEAVYDAYRESLCELVAYLPNVDAITLKERTEENGSVRMLNLWKASQSEVPAVARPFIKPQMLQWNDYAEWRLAERICHWRTELSLMREAIDCSGVNYFEANGEHTTLRLTGTITVDATKVPGVPRLLSRKVSSAVEGFVLKLMEPNLREVNRGLEKFLASQQ